MDEFAVPAGKAVYLSGVPDPPGDLLSAGRGFRVRGLDFSPAGDRLMVADDTGTFDLFDPLTGARPQPARRPGRSPLTIRYDPDPARPRVFSGVREGKANAVRESALLGRVFRVECRRGAGGVYVMGQALVARLDPVTFKSLAVTKPAKDLRAGVVLNAMSVRPDGAEVLVSFGDRVVILNGDTLDPLREWRVGDELLDARYTPDGTKVLVARRDNVAELLDAATGAATTARPMPHARAVTGVAVAPDGSVLLTGSRDGTARFWDAATGLPLGAPLRHTGPVTHVAFAPKGDHVATGTGAGHVMVWDRPPAPAKGTIDELRAKLKAP
jgi:WD40 repeat protein